MDRHADPGPGAVAIDSISYGEAGEVVVQGRTSAPGDLKIALDGQARAEDSVETPGPWRITLPGVAPGTYRLSVKVAGPDGALRAHTETPFRRVPPEQVPAAALPGVEVVTVQPGASLWRIADDAYGSGYRYVQVFEANRDRIDDPDLIYPGQLLIVPD